MQRILTISIFCFSCCIPAQLALGTTNVTIQPYKIKFNYEAGYSNDALTVSDNGETVTGPEWAYGSAPDSFAYIMGQSNRNIQVRFDSNCSSMHLIINLTVTSGTGIGTVCNYFVANYTALDWITITLTGSINASVGTRNFTWQWSIYAISNDAAYCSATGTFNTSHTYYTLLAAPQAPMAEPWASVLDYACSWASGKTNESGVVTKITEGAYNNLGVIYYGGYSHSFLPNFDLSGMLNDGWADCRDMSTVVQVFSNALGSYNIVVKTIDYYSGSFYYKNIYPVGNTSPQNGLWNFHQFGYLNNVYDACLKLIGSSIRIPVNEAINGSYKDDLFQSGDWNVESGTFYQYVY